MGLPSWRRERLRGYLTVFTIVTNVVRELVGELNLRSVEAFLRFVERHLGELPGLMCFVGHFIIIQKFINNYTEYYPWERVSTRGIGASTTRTS